MRGDTLLKDILEGRIKRKKQSGRPRCETLDWMMNRDDGCTYQNLKEMPKNMDRLLPRTCHWADNLKKRRSIILYIFKSEAYTYR